MRTKASARKGMPSTWSYRVAVFLQPPTHTRLRIAEPERAAAKRKTAKRRRPKVSYCEVSIFEPSSNVLPSSDNSLAFHEYAGSLIRAGVLTRR